MSGFDANYFRNLKEIEYTPAPGINVIYGKNGQGKTNLMEAIWLFSGTRSFRGAKESELLAFGEKQCTMKLLFEDSRREQKAEISFGEKKEYLLNQVPLKSASGFNGEFYCVIFSPSHLSIVQDGPKERRNFLDRALCQLKPNYTKHLSDYTKICSQRNALLKSGAPYIREQVELWDIQLAKIGTILTIYRQDYIKKLKKIAVPIYAKLTGNQEEVGISYQSTVFGEEQLGVSLEEGHIDHFKKALAEGMETDLKLGSTSAGVHRDDIDITVNGLSAKTYGSQGQQRSCVLTMKLAEAAMIKYDTGENPVVILDDVLSELDHKRQEYILTCLENLQVFITCCEINDNLKQFQGNIVHMENGRLEL